LIFGYHTQLNIEDTTPLFVLTSFLIIIFTYVGIGVVKNNFFEVFISFFKLKEIKTINKQNR
jgi:hypothetical protein